MTSFSASMNKTEDREFMSTYSVQAAGSKSSRKGKNSKYLHLIICNQQIFGIYCIYYFLKFFQSVLFTACLAHLGVPKSFLTTLELCGKYEAVSGLTNKYWLDQIIEFFFFSFFDNKKTIQHFPLRFLKNNQV